MINVFESITPDQTDDQADDETKKPKLPTGSRTRIEAQKNRRYDSAQQCGNCVLSLLVTSKPDGDLRQFRGRRHRWVLLSTIIGRSFASHLPFPRTTAAVVPTTRRTERNVFRAIARNVFPFLVTIIHVDASVVDQPTLGTSRSKLRRSRGANAAWDLSWVHNWGVRCPTTRSNCAITRPSQTLRKGVSRVHCKVSLREFSAELPTVPRLAGAQVQHPTMWWCTSSQTETPALTSFSPGARRS